MSSTVRHGFSTLNRILGKKNKDSSLSKSTSNLSRSTTNLDTSSQHNNKIVPLPVASNNAPFEQTFRITVCLPRDQLFVQRLGAKTKLKELLQIVCKDKQLDIDKYEFRHPGDNSQVFSNELTIGEVGLNEIRLVLKTADKYNSINHYDDYKKYRQNNVNGNTTASSIITSSSSSDTPNSGYYSTPTIDQNSTVSNYGKTTTISPYSSTNSLNSCDSSGKSSTMSKNNNIHQQQPIAPKRKKRAAPRPPSQNSIAENQPPPLTNGNTTTNNNNNNDTTESFKRPLPRNKDFHVSSPNIITKVSIERTPELSNNTANTTITTNDISQRPKSLHITKLNDNTNDDMIMDKKRPQTQHYDSVVTSPASTVETPMSEQSFFSTVSHSRTSSELSEYQRDEMNPEPTPRKRSQLSGKKKMIAPPVPPQRTLPPTAPPRNLPPTMVIPTVIDQPIIDDNNNVIINENEKHTNHNIRHDDHHDNDVQSAILINSSSIIIDNQQIDNETNSKVTTTTTTTTTNVSKTIESLPEIQSNKSPVITKKLPIESEQNISVSPPTNTNTIINTMESALIPSSMMMTTTTTSSSTNVSKIMLNVDENTSTTVESLPTSPTTTTTIINQNDIERISIKSENISNAIDQTTKIGVLVKNTLSSSTESIPISIATTTGTQYIESSDEEETKIYSIQTGQQQIQLSNNNNNIKDDKKHNNDVDSNNNNTIETINIVNIPSPPIKSINHVKMEEVVLDRSPTSPTILRPESPLWTYTIPAPPTFADHDHQLIAPTATIDSSNDTSSIKTLNSSDHQSSSTISSSTLSTISSNDKPIEPMVKERLPLDFNEVVQNQSMKINESNRTQIPQPIVMANNINADVIEDDYRLNEHKNQPTIPITNNNNNNKNINNKFSREALLQSLERNDNQFIENEFDFLQQIDTKSDSIGNVDDIDIIDQREQPTMNGDMIATDYIIPIANNNNNNNNVPNNNIVENNSKNDIVYKNNKRNSLTNFSIQSYDITNNNYNNNNIHHYIDKQSNNMDDNTVIVNSMKPNENINDDINNNNIVDNNVIKENSNGLHSNVNTMDDDNDDGTIFRKPLSKTKFIQQRNSFNYINGNAGANLIKTSQPKRSDSFHAIHFGNKHTVDDVDDEDDDAGDIKNINTTTTNNAIVNVEPSDFNNTSHKNESQYNSTTTPPTLSSSFLSLMNAQRFDKQIALNKWNETVGIGDEHLPMNNEQIKQSRKSSSSGSENDYRIADSPSLQSLSVMKTILSNSRKNLTTIDDDHDHNESVISKSLVAENHPPQNQQLLNQSNDSNNNNNNDMNGQMNGNDSNVISSENNIQSMDHFNDDDTVEIRKLQNNNTVNGNGDENIIDIGKTVDFSNEDPVIYKYQGPPSINLSTWGERPKSIVCIKSDSDYKFGGGGSNQGNIENDHQLNNNNNNNISDKIIKLNQRNSIPHIIDPHQPIVRAVELKKKISLQDNVIASNENHEKLELRRPSYDISTYLLEKSIIEPSNRNPHQHINNGTSQQISNQSGTISNNQHSVQNVVNNMITIHKFVPTVKGFKTTTTPMQPTTFAGPPQSQATATTIKSSSTVEPLSIQQSKQPIPTNGHRYSDISDLSKSSVQENDINTRLSLNNNSNNMKKFFKMSPYNLTETTTTTTTSSSSSIINPSPKIKQNTTTTTTTNNIPFSQFTLRKTGLKEKILAEDESQKIDNQNTNNNKQSITNGKITIEPEIIKLNTKNTNVVKQSIQQQQREESTIQLPKQLPNINVFKTSTVLIKNPIQAPTPKSQFQQNKNDKILTGNTITISNSSTQSSLSPSSSTVSSIQTPSAPAPPPPAPPKMIPIVRSAVKKQLPPQNTIDPRDQLLSAIRNFNKDGLAKK